MITFSVPTRKLYPHRNYAEAQLEAATRRKGYGFSRLEGACGKYHSNKFTLNDIRNLSDEICHKYGVQTLEKPVVNQRTDGITTGEYRSAMKGESWKIDLINVIDGVMKQAKTQKQFCFLMRQRGYGVRWEEPEEDEDIKRHSDSKILAEEIRRKEALGMHMG